MKDGLGISAGFLLPHPPIIVPNIGRGEEKKAADTIRAMKRVASKIADIRPDTVVVISPHAPLFSNYVYIYGEEFLEGTLERFGSGLKVSFQQDSELVEQIEQEMRALSIPGGRNGTATISVDQLDHGAVVPLYYLSLENADFKLVVMSPSLLGGRGWQKLGKAIKQAVGKTKKRVVIVASGDLSHRVNENSPYGACPEGAKFDRELVRLLKERDVSGILNIDAKLREKAGECGYGALSVLLGAFSGKTEIEVLSYEAPFGIGYCVAFFTSGQANTSAHVTLAREALARYLETGKRPALKSLEWILKNDKELLEKKAGVFVSLKKRGALRGCIGTISPTTDCIAEEIIRNAISAGTADPRFYPVTEEELPELTISVDVLGEAEPVKSKDELHPKRFGVIVEKGMRRGLLLPDLEGVDTVDKQLEIACSKAGIDPDGQYSIYRFIVTRHK